MKYFSFMKERVEMGIAPVLNNCDVTFVFHVRCQKMILSVINIVHRCYGDICTLLLNAEILGSV